MTAVDSTTEPAFHRGSASGGEYVPFQYADPEGTLQTTGEIAWIRDHGSGDGTLLVGVWRIAGPAVTPVYSSEPGDETFLVLEGEVTIEVVGTGERQTFRTGDVGSWSKGTHTRWHFPGDFKKLVVVAHDTPFTP